MIWMLQRRLGKGCNSRVVLTVAHGDAVPGMRMITVSGGCSQLFSLLQEGSLLQMPLQHSCPAM